MVGPSVFPEKQVISEWLVLQYFQKRRLYQNGWSFSISREAGYIKMLGPSVFPDSQAKNPVLRFQNIHFSESVAKSESPDPPIRSVSSSQYRRNPRGLNLIANFGQKQIFL